jgi:hypothetical protein
MVCWRKNSEYKSLNLVPFSRLHDNLHYTNISHPKSPLPLLPHTNGYSFQTHNLLLIPIKCVDASYTNLLLGETQKNFLVSKINKSGEVSPVEYTYFPSVSFVILHISMALTFI